MFRFHAFLAILLGAHLFAAPAAAQQFSALARVDPDRTLSVDDGGGLALDVALTQAVPYRVFTLNDPMRVILDFREVTWDGLKPARLERAGAVQSAALGRIAGGWSRMVLTLARPLAVDTAGMATNPTEGTATVQLRLSETTPEAFALAARPPKGATDDARRALAATRPQRPGPGDTLTVVLDPGHGGVDVGAVAGDLQEADLTLTFARELKETLLRTGRYRVLLTRNEDRFVPLETRVAFANQSGADLFISLHADTIAEGRASGATVYTLSATATDIASEKLAERHNRKDLLVGLDLSAQDDTVARVLMDIARLDTAPRSENLAAAIVQGIEGAGARISNRPRRSSGFSVLKSPDIPSVLIELGFLSDKRDLRDLTSAEWRQRMTSGIRTAIGKWADQDAARAEHLRN